MCRRIEQVFFQVQVDRKTGWPRDFSDILGKVRYISDIGYRFSKGTGTKVKVQVQVQKVQVRTGYRNSRGRLWWRRKLSRVRSSKKFKKVHQFSGAGTKRYTTKVWKGIRYAKRYEKVSGIRYAVSYAKVSGIRYQVRIGGVRADTWEIDIVLSFAPSAAAVWHCDRVRITRESKSVRHSVFFKRWAGQFVFEDLSTAPPRLFFFSWAAVASAFNFTS